MHVFRNGCGKVQIFGFFFAFPTPPDSQTEHFEVMEALLMGMWLPPYVQTENIKFKHRALD